ncbi:hypothetical protein [Mediterraneibacter gnavus]|uniref:hypothetical protein n=1 Tax=Mediterraneibacter gnavus TaxID=33038 RepID=UPI001A99E8B2|nr:hypothetical protein [Mediterraneibacter gnavus]
MENVSHKGVTDDWAVFRSELGNVCYTRCRQNPVEIRMRLTTGISMRLMGPPSKGTYAGH